MPKNDVKSKNPQHVEGEMNKNTRHIAVTIEFVTCGVELLRGHCTDIPADQGSWKRICAICSF